MTYFIGSPVQVAAWVALGADTEITYHVLAEADTVEFSLGNCHELELQTSEAGLQRCVAEFTAALDELRSKKRDSGSEAPEPGGVRDAPRTPVTRHRCPAT